MMKRLFFALIILIFINSLALADAIGFGDDVVTDLLLGGPFVFVIVLFIGVILYWLLMVFDHIKNKGKVSINKRKILIYYAIIVCFMLPILYFTFVYNHGIFYQIEEADYYKQIESYTGRKISKSELKDFINIVADFNSSVHGNKNWIELESNNKPLNMVIGGSWRDAMYGQVDINGNAGRYEITDVVSENSTFELDIDSYDSNGKILKILIIEK